MAERLIVAGFFESIADQVPVGGARSMIGRALAERAGAVRWLMPRPPVAEAGDRSASVGRSDLAPGEARRFDVAGLRVALVRIGDDFHAVGDRCSHEDFSLAEGEVWPDECEIECAKHGSTFDLRTGAAVLAAGHPAGPRLRGGGRRRRRVGGGSVSTGRTVHRGPPCRHPGPRDPPGRVP